MNVLLTNLRELAIALDQALNVIVSLLTWQVGWSDETMSAHAHRSWKAGKLWGRFWRPVIDFLFAWQGFPSHCAHAYEKERERQGLPPEYRL